MMKRMALAATLALLAALCLAGVAEARAIGPPRPIPPPNPVETVSGSSPNFDDNNLNGYYWTLDDVWVPGLITIDTWFTPTPRYAIGGAVFYGPNVMEGTARWRGMSLDGYLGGVAMMSPADIGTTVWIRRPGHSWEGPYLVVDTAMRHDAYPVVVYREEVVEVGYKTALRWGMVKGKEGGGWQARTWYIPDVEVLKSDELPSWAEDARDVAIPVDYDEWYLDIVEFSAGYEYHPYYVRPARWDMRDGNPPVGFKDFRVEPIHFVE